MGANGLRYNDLMPTLTDVEKWFDSFIKNRRDKNK